MTADLDWRQEGPQTWDIEVDADGGTLRLSGGGARLSIDGAAQEVTPQGEYPALYSRMAELVRTVQSEVDLAPMVHVADAMSLGRRVTVAAFDFD